MKYRRLEFVGMFAVVLLLNLLFSVWWLAGKPVPTAFASRLNQEVEAAAVVIPRTFSYQGTLRDATGKVINGTVDLTLRIYKVVTGGTALHTESFDDVPVRAGVFNIVVGDAAPIAASVFDNFPLYLGISVNTDPEMLPRQRLHPVPYAMQATSAQTAVTANNLVQGGGVPNLVNFGAGGAKKIGFPDGGSIVDSAAGMTIGGGGAEKAITTGGDLTVGGDLSVTGSWSAGAIRDVGDSNGGANQRSTYPVNINRYVVEAPDNGASPDTVPVDSAILTEFCQDQDGCSFYLYMRDWDDANGRGLLAGFSIPLHLSLAPPDGTGKQQWDRRDGTANSPGATFDKNGVIQHLMTIYDACIFTDGEYVNAVGSDNASGYGLLNWFGTYNSTNMTCVLVIED